MKKTAENPLFTPEEIEVGVYDAAEFLDSDEAIAGYLAISLEDPDPDVFLKALGNALRAKGLPGRLCTGHAGPAKNRILTQC